MCEVRAYSRRKTRLGVCLSGAALAHRSRGHSWRSLAEVLTSFPTKICMVEHVSNPNITDYYKT